MPKIVHRRSLEDILEAQFREVSADMVVSQNPDLVLPEVGSYARYTRLLGDCPSVAILGCGFLASKLYSYMRSLRVNFYKSTATE